MSQVIFLGSGNSPLAPIVSLTPDNGNIVLPDGAQNIDVLGGNNTNGFANIQTDGNPYNEPPVVPLNTLKIRLTDSVILPAPSITSATGVIALGFSGIDDDRFLYRRSDSNFIGYKAGNFTFTNGEFNTGVGQFALSNLQDLNRSNVAVGYAAMSQPLNFTQGNVGVGFESLSNFRTGTFNTGVGFGTLSLSLGGFDNNTAIGAQSLNQVTGSNNSGLGASALGSLLSGIANQAIGFEAGVNIQFGSYNSLMGHQVAVSYIGAESNNIIISNDGQVGDNNIIRIGTTGVGNGQQTQCYIAAIANVVVANQHFVMIDSLTEQLGSVDSAGYAAIYNADLGSATPALGQLNIFGGTGIVTGGAGNTITISSIVAPVSWSVIAVNQTAVVNNGYFCNKAGTLALALPAASAVGDIIEVSNINTALGIQFTQAAGQRIFIGNTSTTLGATGTLTSIAVGDSLKLVCGVANTFWYAVSSMGNWTPA